MPEAVKLRQGRKTGTIQNMKKHSKYTVTATGTAAQQIETALRSIKGCQFIRMQTLTSAGLRKTRDNAYTGKREAHGYGDIQKFSDGQYLVGFRYENSLANQAKREGKVIEFDVQDRAWGTHVEGTCLIENHGSLYVETLPQQSFCTSYQDEQGNDIARDDIADLIDHKESRRERSTTQDELTKEIIVRDYKLTNVLYLVANHYTVGASRIDYAEPELNTDAAWDKYRESQADLNAMSFPEHPAEGC
jgi:hypothetical protein